jgi:hypothetical protein
VIPLHCSALCICFLGRLSEALGGLIFTVPLAQVTACETVPAILAKVDREQVRFHALAVPLEFAPLPELGVRTVSVLDLAASRFSRTAPPTHSPQPR